MPRYKRRRWKNFGGLSKASTAVKTTRQDPTAGWWMTVRTQPTTCDRCPKITAAGKAVVYHHEPRASLCVRCAKQGGIPFKPSKAFLRAEAKASQMSLLAP